MRGNHTGVGGFRDHPENINRSGVPKGSFTFSATRYKAMNDHELEEVIAEYKAGTLSQAQQWALLNVLDARKRNREGFKRLEYLVDRTEGKAAQQISIQQAEAPIPLLDLDEIKAKARALRGKHAA